MKNTLVFWMAAALAGCASVSESYAPDGQRAYTLNCSGYARGWDKCFSKAGELCGTHGYTVVDRNGETGAVMGGNGYGWGGGTTSERSMVIECKTP